MGDTLKPFCIPSSCLDSPRKFGDTAPHLHGQLDTSQEVDNVQQLDQCTSQSDIVRSVRVIGYPSLNSALQIF